jgi:hypothetical protein
MQYQALLATEGVTLDFAADGIKRLAEIAWSVNERTENIGARRLYTVMERLLEEVSFSAGEGALSRALPSMPAMWTAGSPNWRRTRICRATFFKRPAPPSSVQGLPTI